MAPRVLIADDEESIREVVSFYVAREGYEPVCARDGDEAIELFRRGGFDLVVLDAMMPGRSGFEVCSAIRDVDEDVPVVFLSAKGDLIDKSLGFKLGADDYVTKPFDPDELVLRIGSRLRRRSLRRVEAASARDAVVLGDLSIDLRQREVRVGGERAILTSKEFDILAFLAREPGMVLSRGQILRGVWGDDYVGDPGVLAVLVRRLREKIESDPSHPVHLLTEWGVGYRLV